MSIPFTMCRSTQFSVIEILPKNRYWLCSKQVTDHYDTR